MLADMVIVDQNPLQNFKVLYGTGAVRLNDKTGKAERVGGVKYTIKDGIVYDAKKLLADVAAMVEKQKKERAGKTTTTATARRGSDAREREARMSRLLPALDEVAARSSASGAVSIAAAFGALAALALRHRDAADLWQWWIPLALARRASPRPISDRGSCTGAPTRGDATICR